MLWHASVKPLRPVPCGRAVVPFDGRPSYLIGNERKPVRWRT
jgi:hypothetical protein